VKNGDLMGCEAVNGRAILKAAILTVLIGSFFPYSVGAVQEVLPYAIGNTWDVDDSGTKIVFYPWIGANGVYLADANGNTKIMPDASPWSFRQTKMSGDGSIVVFDYQEYSADSTHLYFHGLAVARTDRWDGVKKIYDYPKDESGAYLADGEIYSWFDISGDGSTIAVGLHERPWGKKEKISIIRLNADGGDQRVLLKGEIEWGPVPPHPLEPLLMLKISADGQKILFRSGLELLGGKPVGGQMYRLYMMDSDGQNLKIVSPLDLNAGNFFIDHDASTIVANMWEKDDYMNDPIYLLKLDRENPEWEKIADHNVYPGPLSTDGRKMFFCDENNSLGILDLPTGILQRMNEDMRAYAKEHFGYDYAGTSLVKMSRNGSRIFFDILPPGKAPALIGYRLMMQDYDMVSILSKGTNYIRGDFVDIYYETKTSSLKKNKCDVYMCAVIPGNQKYFLGADMRWSASPVPFVAKTKIGDAQGKFAGALLLGNDLPNGEYKLLCVLVESGKSPFNTGNWRSGIASASFQVMP